MTTLALTVPANGAHGLLRVRVSADQIVALGPAAGGGTVVRIPTRTFTVSERLDEVLAQWLGPRNGDSEPQEVSHALE